MKGDPVHARPPRHRGFRRRPCRLRRPSPGRTAYRPRAAGGPSRRRCRRRAAERPPASTPPPPRRRTTAPAVPFETAADTLSASTSKDRSAKTGGVDAAERNQPFDGTADAGCNPPRTRSVLIEPGFRSTTSPSPDARRPATGTASSGDAPTTSHPSRPCPGSSSFQNATGSPPTGHHATTSESWRLVPPSICTAKMDAKSGRNGTKRLVTATPAGTRASPARHPTTSSPRPDRDVPTATDTQTAARNVEDGRRCLNPDIHAPPRLTRRC